ncbi:HD domain-containing phosphohydrolase, partial [Geitlerinema sp. P-1104]|uniref:HD domain-containing phosphohydrolase n=1 Tax=Geitlerinema sp. P-1104 TaxID=2546230 RepID=UPI0014770350
MMVVPDPNFLSDDGENLEFIEQLFDIGAALSSRYDLSELLDLILCKSREMTCSDAGSLYLVDRSCPEFPVLLFKVAQNDSRPTVSFREFAMPLTKESIAGYVALTGESLNLTDAYHPPQDAPYRFNRNFDVDIGYRTRSMLAIPMHNRHGETIGVLQLLNRKVRPEIILRPDNVVDSTQPYSSWERRIVQFLASQAGISIERNHLQTNIEQLFEGFIRTSIQAIEMRDPSTSGHSERVAQLAVRLLEEVNHRQTGVWQEIHFSDAQKRELRYAALLHDFGKIGVPEAILTKEKKLYPHQQGEICHRFGVARRTLELDVMQAKYHHLLPESDGEETLKQLDERLSQQLKQLDHYWQVIELANTSPQLDDETLAFLDEVAQSHYRDVDGHLKPLLTAAELEQLRVVSGNLTPSERTEIELHVRKSYEFLKQIPWTQNLANVPNLAVAHHEKLDGSGYPQGLKAEEIPLQTQIMTIADIYDALTAGDRPY